MNFNLSCDRYSIGTLVPLLIQEAQSADGNISPLVARLLHNKVGFWISGTSQCYLSYFSPEFILSTFTLVGLIFFLLGLWLMIKKRKFAILLFVSTGPLPFITSVFHNNIIAASYLYFCQLILIGIGLIDFARSMISFLKYHFKKHE